MGRKRRKQKRGKTKRPAPCAAAVAELEPEAQREQCERALEAGSTRQALAAAKTLHKADPSPATEGLLTRAYRHRIRDLLDSGMRREAADLLRLTEERFPGARPGLRSLRAACAVAQGDLAGALAPLLQPDPDPEAVAAVHEALRKHLTRPSRLADCTALPPSHPLRKAAQEIAAALDAVTSGPVPEDRIALPGVARRSPLAPWKWTVLAIAAFYHHRDEKAREFVGRLAPDDAPHPLGQTLLELLDRRRPAGEGQGAARALYNAVCGGAGALAEALDALEAALAADSRKQLARAIRQALTLCQRQQPDRCEELRQRISIRGFDAGWDEPTVRSALGGPSRHDATFWRLFARQLEQQEELPLLVCAHWEAFRRAALHEGWFAPGGAEEGTVYLHMLKLLEPLAEEPQFRQLQQRFRREYVRRGGLADYYEGQPPEVTAHAQPDPPDLYFTDPSALYRRACQCLGDGETYQRWYRWQRRREDDWHLLDPIAEAWHQRCPEDSRPLLILSASAETRQALKRARTYLAAAEALDGLNPAIQVRRLRLLVGEAKRHLRQGKPHLARRDLQGLAETPAPDPTAHSAVVHALRRCIDASERQRGQRPLLDTTPGVETDGGVDGLPVPTPVAEALCAMTALACLPERQAAPLVPEALHLATDMPLLAAIGRAVACAAQSGLEVEPAPAWRATVHAAARKGAAGLGPDELLLLGQAAQRAGWAATAYALTHWGLAGEAAWAPDFLLLRAACLDGIGRFPDRIFCLLQLATHLARQHQRRDLPDAVEACLQSLHRRTWQFSARDQVRPRIAEPLPAADASQRLQREIQAGIDPEALANSCHLEPGAFGFAPPTPFGPGGLFHWEDEPDDDEDDWLEEDEWEDEPGARESPFDSASDPEDFQAALEALRMMQRMSGSDEDEEVFQLLEDLIAMQAQNDGSTSIEDLIEQMAEQDPTRIETLARMMASLGPPPAEPRAGQRKKTKRKKRRRR